MTQSNAIRIGTLVKGDEGTAAYVQQILPHGFESYSVTFWQACRIDLEKLSQELAAVLAQSGAVVSSLSVFGNPLGDTPIDEETRNTWRRLIDAAPLFGTDIVSGFAGRVRGQPIDESYPRFREVFSELARYAADRGVRLAFENCAMGGNWQSGDWNIAQHPKNWEAMFDAVPADNVGLEWEPCHQLLKLIEPLPQLKAWVNKVFHVHGKDASVHWDVVREHGVGGGQRYAFDRTPGFGDSNWTDIVSELRRGGFCGSIDIEGWHDPVYRDELEMTGQVHALNYLKRCRGGAFVPNPS